MYNHNNRPMPTQTQTTITKDDLNEALAPLIQNQRDMKNSIARIWWVMSAFLAFLLFVAGLMFFTWGDTKNLQAEVDILQNQHAVQHP